MAEKYEGNIQDLLGVSDEDMMDVGGVHGDKEPEPEEGGEELTDEEVEATDSDAGADDSEGPEVEGESLGEDDESAGDGGEGEEVEEGDSEEGEEVETRTWELKAYGKTKAVESEEELLRYANLGLASDVKNKKSNERLSQAKQIETDSRRILESITKDPMSAYLMLAAERLGSMEKAMATLDQHVNAYWAPRFDAVQNKTEEAYLQSKELEWREQKIREREEKERAEAESRQRDAYYAQLTRDTNKAIDDEGLPRTKLIYGRVAKIMQEALDLDLTPDPVEAVKEVAQSLKPEERESPQDKAEKEKEKKSKVEKVKRNRTKRTANSQGGSKPNRRERRAGPQTSIGSFFTEVFKEINQ